MTTTKQSVLTAEDLVKGIKDIQILRDIIEHHQMAKIQIAGKSVSVDVQTANALILVFDACNFQAQCKFAAMIYHSQNFFNKILEFTWDHVKA